MRNASAAYKAAIQGDRQYTVRILITYTDGTQDDLTDLSDFRQIKFIDECSGSSEFEVGAAIIGEAVITLNNRSGKFDGKDFYGAKITAYVGILVDGTPELLQMGRYVVDEPVSPGISIQLIAYDHMIYLDKTYVPTVLFPATRLQLARDAVEQCGLTLTESAFTGASEMVTAAPTGTCRELLAAIAQLGGCFVRANNAGGIEIRWYADTTSHTITSLKSKTICTDDVTVTGIAAYDGSNLLAQAGADGYMLAIKDNPLLTADAAQEVVNALATALVGMTFRPLSVSCKSDPSIEAGDKVAVMDGNETYETYVTSTTFAVLEAQSVACNAASPTVNSSRRLSETARAVLKANEYTKELVERERTAREAAIESLAERISTSSGLYMTRETQPDGSAIYYMHDKSLLEESGIVWKLTAEALGISTDGGKTYPYGLDVSGTAILERIYTVGLNADYINSGTFVARGADGKVVFAVNVDTGQITMHASSITMGAGNLEAYVDDVKQTAEAAVQSNIEEFYSSSSPTQLTDGTWSTSQPTWYEGTYIWRRTKVTYGTGAVEYSPSEMGVCITGNTGAAGKGISGVTNYFLATTASSGVTTSTSGWTATMQSTTTTNKYLWCYQQIKYTDNTTSNTAPVIIGTHGATGQTGATGATGKGISTVTNHYLATSAATGVTTSTTGWTTTMQSTTTTNRYLWCYQTITYTDNTSSNTVPAIIGTHGATGAAGADAITLSVTSSNGTVFKNSSGSTVLTAHVYVAGVEQSITDAGVCGTLGSIKWYKGTSTTAIATAKTLTVSAVDVTSTQAYTCQLEG